MRVRSSRFAIAATLIGASAGVVGPSACIVHGADRAYPLYPAPRLERRQVALLLGAIATVDGKDVALDGSTFELLPGCHLVTTQTKLLAYDTSTSTNAQGEVTGTLPRLTYAIAMQPGHTYAIERQIQAVGGTTADVQITARDVAADGQSADLPPARSLAAVAACVAAARRYGDGPPSS
jgi:hypothetical protein